MGDVDVGEDRLVELASGRFTGVEMQLVGGVLEQIEVGVEERSAAGEVAVYLAELLGHALPVTGDVAQALADAFLRERAIGGEVEEVVFFDGELCELVFEVLAEQLLRGDLVVQGGLDVVADGGNERGGAESDGFCSARRRRLRRGRSRSMGGRRRRGLVARQSVIRTSILPVFAPRIMARNASTVLSMPSTTVSS